ncbi:MAG: diguanylate cyclase, partial [Gammaproteobacteria bacterium]
MNYAIQNNDGPILVVDDDPTLRLLVRASLEKSGFQVEEAADGLEAVEKFVSCKPIAILMDVDMPKLDGYGACTRIREDAAGAHVPIMMVTGMEDNDSIDLAYSVGATDFISKPINWTMLGHRVRYVLRAALAFQDLRVSEAKNDALVKAIPDTLFVVRRSGEIIDYLPGSDTGPLTEPRGDQQTIFDYLPAEVAKRWHKLILEVAISKSPRQCELILGDTDSAHHYELQIVPYMHDLTLTIFREITDRKQAEQRIHSLAYYDTLTGLPNRQLFQQQLIRAIESAEKHGRKVAALYVDLDNFKRINDTLGHSFGDAVLKTIARRLERCIRFDDTVSRADADVAEPHLARLGGDEFVSILQNLRDEEQAVAVAERIRIELMRPV